MKFLVLALCVCAASAASFGAYKPYSQSGSRFPASQFGAVGVASSRYSPPAPAPVVPAPFVPAPVVPAPVSAVAVAKTAKSDAEAEIISNESEVLPTGFNQHYETNNGISAQSSGVLKKVGDTNALVITGSYRYYAADGTPVVVNYVADENGYNAQSDSIPVAPPVPQDIARAVEYVLKNGKPEESQKY